MGCSLRTSPGTVQIDSNTAATHGWWQQARASNDILTGIGTVGGPAQPALARTVIPQFTCLGRGAVDVQALIVPDISKIGTGFLKHFRVTLDLKGSRLWLE